MRITKFFIILGIAFLLASFLPSRSANYESIVVDRNHYECFLVRGAGNLFVEASGVEDRNISLYVLSYDDTLVLIQEDSLENTTPIFMKENILHFSDVINLPERDWYGIVVTFCFVNSSFGETSLHIHIAEVTPYPAPFFLFVVSEVLGLGSFIYRKREL
ncbi:MAG: hypothetical protein EAX81_05800 [Candidatus Thorarchaeota archaeon]|nr:hypothetical protein [Candidatus Thorarchaeota archaeon]